MKKTLNNYSASDFLSAMYTNFPNAQWLAQLGLLPSCGQDFVSYLLQQHHNSAFIEHLLSLYPTEAAALWTLHGSGGPYPGNPSAAAYFASTAPIPQFQDDFASSLISNLHDVDFIAKFVLYHPFATLDTDIAAYSDVKNCLFLTKGDQTFEILDLYSRSLLWDKMILNRTPHDMMDDIITYNPQAFVKSYLTLYPTEATDLMANSLSGGYHVTDYLNAILNYPAFGTSYYTNIVNQLMGLGYVTGGWNYQAEEHHIYGSSRIGVHQTNTIIRTRYASGDISITLENVEYTSLYRGKRHYELSNHLGNVQVVVSDKRISVCDSELEVEYFKAEVLSAVDYYPFGMMMPDRQYYANSDSSIAVNGFNGMRKDDEISGVGNSLDFGARIYDSKLGRFLSVDPMNYVYVFISPYNFAQNNPLAFVDVGGFGAGSKDGGLSADETKAKEGKPNTSGNSVDFLQSGGSVAAFMGALGAGTEPYRYSGVADPVRTAVITTPINGLDWDRPQASLQHRLDVIDLSNMYVNETQVGFNTYVQMNSDGYVTDIHEEYTSLTVTVSNDKIVYVKTTMQTHIVLNIGENGLTTINNIYQTVEVITSEGYLSEIKPEDTNNQNWTNPGDKRITWTTNDPITKTTPTEPNISAILMGRIGGAVNNNVSNSNEKSEEREALRKEAMDMIMEVLKNKFPSYE